VVLSVLAVVRPVLTRVEEEILLGWSGLAPALDPEPARSSDADELPRAAIAPACRPPEEPLPGNAAER
jgi:hypothetical protein